MSSMTRFVKSFLLFMFSICVIAQAQEASVQEESFEVKTPDDVTLHGKLYVKSKETPLVILIHMLNRSEEDWKVLTPSLLEKGFNVVSFDMRGHGKSIQDDKTWKSFSDADFLKIMDDVVLIKQKLKEQNKIAVDKIYIVGASIGANLAVKFAHKDASILGLVLLSPGISYHGVDIQEDIVFPRKMPVFFVTSLGDKYSHESTQKLVEKYKASKNASTHELKVFSSGEHGTALFQRYPELKDTIADWFKKMK